MMKNKLNKTYWYKIHVGECPVCGRYQNWRERIYSPKPKNLEDRYTAIPHKDSYCGCMN